MYGKEREEKGKKGPATTERILLSAVPEGFFVLAPVFPYTSVSQMAVMETTSPYVIRGVCQSRCFFRCVILDFESNTMCCALL